jgi:hypothetical protein
MFMGIIPQRFYLIFHEKQNHISYASFNYGERHYFRHKLFTEKQHSSPVHESRSRWNILYPQQTKTLYNQNV